MNTISLWTCMKLIKAYFWPDLCSVILHENNSNTDNFSTSAWILWSYDDFWFLSLWTIMRKPSSFAAIAVKSVRQLYPIWGQTYGNATSRLPSTLINNVYQSMQWRKDMKTDDWETAREKRHQEKGGSENKEQRGKGEGKNKDGETQRNRSRSG